MVIVRQDTQESTSKISSRTNKNMDPTPDCVDHDHDFDSDDFDYSSEEIEASVDDVPPTVRVKRSDDDSQYTNNDYADWGYTDEDVNATNQNEGENIDNARHGRRRGNSHGIMKSRVRMPTSTERNVRITIPKMRGWKCGKDKTRLINLDPKGKLGGKEYKIVVEQMEQTKVAQRSGDFKKYNIIKIEKVVNGCFWKKYKKRQETIRSEAGYANERMLFHGSSKIKELQEHGFDERYANTNGMFGAGVYFAKNSSKSNQYAFGMMARCPTHRDLYCEICERQMMLCRVTLGKMMEEKSANKRPHAPPGHHSVAGIVAPGGSLYFEEYIVYRGEQVYPEYIITYKIVK